MHTENYTWINTTTLKDNNIIHTIYKRAIEYILSLNSFTYEFWRTYHTYAETVKTLTQLFIQKIHIMTYIYIGTCLHKLSGKEEHCSN